MNANNQSTDVELESVENDRWLDLYGALLRLEANEDFKKVILNGYMKDKALESVSLLAVPQMKQQGQRPDIMEDLVAISNLQYYLGMIENMGKIAEDELAEASAPDVEE